MINTFSELVAVVNALDYHVRKLEKSLRAAKIRKDYAAMDKNELAIKIQNGRIEILVSTFENKMRASHLQTKLWERELNYFKTSRSNQPICEGRDYRDIVMNHNKDLVKNFL